MDKLKPVTFLSLGPGDPELLTMKAVRLLREADVVAIPATRGVDGQLTSRAQSIISDFVDAAKVQHYELPMRSNRQAARQVYADMYRSVVDLYQQGRRVVVAVEGDVSIYASIHYVLEQLKTDGIPVTQCAGIPSFIAAAATQELSLVSQQQRLTVLPGDADEDTLLQLLQAGHVVCIMKLSLCADVVKHFLEQHPQVVVHYFENVGTTAAYHTDRHEEVLSRHVPYFSLCVLYPF